MCREGRGVVTMAAKPAAGLGVITADARQLELHDANLEGLQDRRQYPPHQRLAQGREQGGIVDRDSAAAFAVSVGSARSGCRGDAVGPLLTTLPMLHQPRA